MCAKCQGRTARALWGHASEPTGLVFVAGLFSGSCYFFAGEDYHRSGLQDRVMARNRSFTMVRGLSPR